DLFANGDSVGTLPSTNGGHAIVIGQDSGNHDESFGVDRSGAKFYLELPETAVNRAVEAATGAGYVLTAPLGSGLVRMEFHGEVSVVMNEEILRATGAEMGLVSEGSAPVLVGLELDSLWGRPMAFAGGTATAIPVLDLMDGGKTGVQQLVMNSYQAPFRPNRVRLTRGAGILILSQHSY
ncbi:MAG: hypothetical protein P1V35_05930, partial [Planctomycetota bacterium]|nr:hypothetical protein [Planctomycetota bacterium]